MSELKISRRYAKALFDFSFDEKLTEPIYHDMSLIHSVLIQNKELRDFLKSPIIKSHSKLEVINLIFQSKIQKTSFNFLKLIVTQRREQYIKNIASEFIDIYKESKGIKIAKVKTAVAIDASTQQMIIKMLENQIGSKIELDIHERNDLIGGFVLTVDNKEIDTTIKSKLIRLKSEFDDNPYEKKF